VIRAEVTTTPLAQFPPATGSGHSSVSSSVLVMISSFWQQKKAQRKTGITIRRIIALIQAVEHSAVSMVFSLSGICCQL
jgi:hypothetical protein